MRLYGMKEKRVKQIVMSRQYEQWTKWAVALLINRISVRLIGSWFNYLPGGRYTIGGSGKVRTHTLPANYEPEPNSCVST